MVGRSRARCGASPRVSSPSSSTTTGCSASRGRPQWRTIRGGSARYVEALTAPWRDRLRLRAPGRGDRARTDHVLVTAARRRGRALRRGRDRDAFRPGADDCSPTPPPPSTSSSARSRISATRRSCTPTCGMLPRRRRAWASWNYHLLESPSGPHDRHLPHEPPAVAARRARVLRDAEPDLPTIAPDKVIRTIAYAHPIYTADGVKAQARVAEISGRNRTHLLRRVLGLGVPRGRRAQRAARGRAIRGAAVSAELHLRGRGAPPPLRGPRPRVPLPPGARLRRPRRAARPCSTGACSRAAPGSSASAAATTSETRSARSPRPCATRCRAQTGRAPAGPDPTAHAAALVRALLQPGQLLLLLRRVGRAARARARRGHEHAVGRAARVRSERRRRRPRRAAHRQLGQGTARVAVHGRWSTATTGA